MISRLLLWKRCIYLLCVAIWVFPLLSRAIIITDEDAAKKNLDSIYIGTIVATLNSKSKPTSCIPAKLKFGPYASSRLTLGPNHNGWYEPNPFYLAIVGGAEGKFLTSVQSSLTSTQSNKTWWSVQAWQHSGSQGAYQVDGTVVKEADNKVGEERNQLSGVWEVGKSSQKKARREGIFHSRGKVQDKDDKNSGPCARGTKHLLTWRHKKDTTLKGQVGAKDANMVVTGTVVLTIESANKTEDDSEEDSDFEEDDDDNDLKQKKHRLRRRAETQEMTYTLTFSGKYQSGSAPLPMKGLVWEKAGSGPPLKPFEYFTVELPEIQRQTSTSSITRKPTSTRKRTSTATPTGSETTVLVPTTVYVTPTQTPGEHEGDNDVDGIKSPLPHGAIVGIVVGGVLAIVVFLIMLFFVKKWLAKRKEPKVYPELAYIYSTPFTSTNKRSQGGTGGGGGGGVGASSATVATSANTEMQEYQGGGEAEKYYGPAAPQLEVDLGDRAPFLDTTTTAVAAVGSSAAMGSPVRSRGLDSNIDGRSRAEEQEDLEEEMRQPMLSRPGPSSYEGSSAGMEGGKF